MKPRLHCREGSAIFPFGVCFIYLCSQNARCFLFVFLVLFSPVSFSVAFKSCIVFYLFLILYYQIGSASFFYVFSPSQMSLLIISLSQSHQILTVSPQLVFCLHLFSMLFKPLTVSCLSLGAFFVYLFCNCIVIFIKSLSQCLLANLCDENVNIYYFI